MPPLVDDAPPPESSVVHEEDGNGARAANFEALKNFVRFLVCSLVDYPEQVTLTIAEKRDLTIIQIHCVKTDIGKVIGKSGKTISALRTLISSASAHARQWVTVDVMDE